MSLLALELSKSRWGIRDRGFLVKNLEHEQ